MRILVTGAWRFTETERKAVENLGHEVVFMQNEKDELPCAPESVEGVICNGLFLSHPIEKFTALRYVQLTSAGFDRMPMEYAKSHGIVVQNARGVYSVPMAEFALCGVLDLYKRSRFFYENQKNRVWEKHRGVLEIFGKCVAVVGCGSVGTETANMPFKMAACALLIIPTTTIFIVFKDKLMGNLSMGGIKG